MPNPIVFKSILVGLYNLSLVCGWQPIIQFPQPVFPIYQYECVVTAEVGISDPMFFLASGQILGPLPKSDPGSGSNVIQETY